jgi:hypothetical protein
VAKQEGDEALVRWLHLHAPLAFLGPHKRIGTTTFYHQKAAVYICQNQQGKTPLGSACSGTRVPGSNTITAVSLRGAVYHRSTIHRRGLSKLG